MLWVPRNRARETHVSRVTGLVTDRRATHYWDGPGNVIDHYDASLDLTGPCAGIFMIFPPGVTWDGSQPPRPDYYEDAHAREYDRAGPQFDGRRFARRVAEMLR